MNKKLINSEQCSDN